MNCDNDELTMIIGLGRVVLANWSVKALSVCAQYVRAYVVFIKHTLIMS